MGDVYDISDLSDISDLFDLFDLSDLFVPRANHFGFFFVAGANEYRATT